MSARLKTCLGNLALLSVSLLATLAVLELVVFRLILKPDDLLENVSINDVVRYKPKTVATMRHPDGTATRVTINADGWNSTKPAYRSARDDSRLRVAVIGDSYVHGSFVDVAEGFPEHIERNLQAAGVAAEVYRFGMDGAPLSQYLHVLRREALAYRPDVVVVPLIHNDFDESYRFLKTRYASSFMKLERSPDGRVVEVPPRDFRYGLADSLRSFATFRYLYYKTGFYLHAKRWVSRAFWGGDEDWSPEHISSAVDVRKIADHASNRFFAHYVLAEMKELAREHGFKLAVVMDGVREAVYDGRNAAETPAGKLNVIAADLTRELDIPFLDLQSTFAADYAANKARFEFPFDWHWNVRANRLVATAVTDLLLTDPRIGIARKAKAAAKFRPAAQ